MLTLTEIKQTLAEHKQDIMKKYPVNNIALFGSYARGEQKEDSDIDIMVELREPMGWDFVDLVEEFEKIFTAKVDIVSRGGIKERAWEYIKDDLIYV